jgi:hypothetical protein
MKPVFFFVCLLLMFSCKENKDKTTIAPAGKPVADSVRSSPAPEKIVYVKKAARKLRHYYITVLSEYHLPEKLAYDSSTYVKHNFLIVLDENNQRKDTLPISLNGPYFPYIAIKDISDSLHFKTLVIDVDWSSRSDMARVDTSEEGGYFVMSHDDIIECGKDSLVLLFSVDNMDSMQRTDEWTISGIVTSYAEATTIGERPYPFTVSLKDHVVHITPPDAEYIGQLDPALDNIQGRLLSGQTDTGSFTIKKGEEIRVDTLYRALRLVRVAVSDSIVVQISMDDFINKLRHSLPG